VPSETQSPRFPALSPPSKNSVPDALTVRSEGSRPTKLVPNTPSWRVPAAVPSVTQSAVEYVPPCAAKNVVLVAMETVLPVHMRLCPLIAKS
jgi:hypothetical protein